MAKEVIEIDVKTNISGAKSLSDLKGEFKELQKELSGLEQGSEKYIQTLKQLGSVKSEIGDITKELNAFADGTSNLSSFSGVLSGVVSGFEAASGAAALFGMDSGALEEQIKNLQGVMAFSEGIKGVLETGESFKQLGNAIKSTEIGAKAMAVAQRILNAVMAANPIGLLIAGITALIGVIALFVNSMEDEDAAQKQVIANRERELEVMQSQDEALKRQSEFRKQLAAAQGKSAEDLLNIEKINGDARKKRIEEEIVLINKNINDRNKLLANADSDELKKIQENNDKDAKLRKSLYEERIKIDQDYILNKTKLDNETDKKEKENIQKSIDNSKFLYQKLQDLLAQNIAITEEKEIRILELSYQRERDELKSKGANNELLKQLDIKYLNEKKLIEEKYRKESLDENKALIARDNEINKELEEERKKKQEEADKLEDERIEAEIQAEQKGLDKQKAARLKAVEDYKKGEEQKVELTKQGLTAISSLADAFAGEDEASQKRAFEVKKAAGIALATIETYQSASSAYASQMAITTPDAPIRAAVAAGIAIATGVARIATIAKTQFKSSATPSTGGGGSNLGTFSQGGGTQAPGLTSQNNVTQLNPDGSVAGQGNREMQPMKAYVVESESRAVTDRVNKLSNQSKIG
jgi:hypothetical protein